MPVVIREGGLRYFFYSNEGLPREPRHVHVKRRGKDAKVWLEPDVSIADSYAFNSARVEAYSANRLGSPGLDLESVG